MRGGEYYSLGCVVYHIRSYVYSCLLCSCPRVPFSNLPKAVNCARTLRRCLSDSPRVQAHAFRRGSGSTLPGSQSSAMASTERSTALSDAEQRIITIKTEAGDIVKFSGNPAELPGARFETRKALRRAGAFKLLILHNASRLKNGTICTEDLDSIPFVTKVVTDPLADSYDYDSPF